MCRVTLRHTGQKVATPPHQRLIVVPHRGDCTGVLRRTIWRWGEQQTPTQGHVTSLVMRRLAALPES